MSMQSEFVSLVGPLVGGRVFPGGAPAGTIAPYVIYSRVNAVENNTLEVNGGLGNIKNTRLQCDVYALMYADAIGIADKVKTALKTWALQNTLQDEQDFYEFDTRLHRVMLDFSVWHN